MKKTLKIGSDGGWQVGFWRICIGEQMVIVDRGPITEKLTFLSHWFQPISITLRDLSLNSAIIKPLIKLICPISQTRFCSPIAPILVMVTRLPNLATCSAVSPNLFKRMSRISLFLPAPLQKGPICIYIASRFASYISPSWSCLAIGLPTICTPGLASDLPSSLFRAGKISDGSSLRCNTMLVKQQQPHFASWFVLYNVWCTYLHQYRQQYFRRELFTL